MQKIYAFYDEGAKFFGPPIAAQNISMIQRSLRAAAAENAQVPFLQYPREFVLYELAAYDEETGRIEPTTPPARLQSVAEILRPDPTSDYDPSN